MALKLAIANQAYVQQSTHPFDLRPQLRQDLEQFYGRIKDIRSADLGDLWTLARDLVVALDAWGRTFTTKPITGAEKMEIALDVAWAFVAERGGAAALRDRLVDALPGGWLVGKVVSWLLTEDRAKGIVRFVLELAVREVRKFWD